MNTLTSRRTSTAPCSRRLLVAALTLGVTLCPSLATGQSPPVALGTGPLHAHGELYGLGPNYRAIFAPDHVAMFALGGDEPLMEWRIDEVVRERGEPLPFAAAVEPAVDGNRVTFDRGPFREVYDIRDDGLAQSFVFAELPAGTGDLIVTLRLDTALAPTKTEQLVDDLTFANILGATLHFGAITGIDGRGTTATGNMRCRSDTLELRLPAALVADAALPLVLDPLIGLPFAVAATQSAAYAGCSAYDASNGVFLATWADLIAGDFVTLGRFVTPAGEFASPILCIECSPSATGIVSQTVNVSGRDTFVVAVINYFLVAVSAATGDVLVGTGFPLSPWQRHNVSGEVTGADDSLLHVYDDTTHTLTAERIGVDASGELTPVVSRQVVSTPTSGSAIAQFSVAKTGGTDGRTLIVWRVDDTLEATLIDRSLNVLDRLLIPTSPVSKIHSLTDGDGRQWLVLYDTTTDVRGLPVFWDPDQGRLWTGGEVVLAPTPDPLADIGWLGESCLATTGAGIPPASAHRVLSIDPFTCLPCEASAATTVSRKQIGTQRSGMANAGDWALLTDAAAIGQRFRANDGVTTDLGGGCGDGGWAAATCARVGNQNFTLRLRDAAPGVPAFLAVGASQLGFRCGPCQLVVDPVLIVPTGPTDPLHGCAEAPAPLANDPGLIGATFLMQWLTVNGNQCFGVEFSNALRVEVQ